jgi:hypothetical protein
MKECRMKIKIKTPRVLDLYLINIILMSHYKLISMHGSYQERSNQ